jgi:hypothetical protein
MACRGERGSQVPVAGSECQDYPTHRSSLIAPSLLGSSGPGLLTGLVPSGGTHRDGLGLDVPPRPFRYLLALPIS